MLNCDKARVASEQKRKECVHLAKEHITTTLAKLGRPVVLSQKRFTALKDRSEKLQKVQQDIAAEKEQREKLKGITQALMVEYTKMQRKPDSKKAMEEKDAQARASLKFHQDNDEQLRREKIRKAELLVQKLKAGPRELRSAAMKSEMLRARDIQLQVNAEIQNAYEKQEQADKAACLEEFKVYAGEELERVEERRAREDAYKTEMLEKIREDNRMRVENRKKLIEEQRRERALIDAEVQADIERERKAVEKKREALRRNAIEAMKMAEERKKRELMYDEVEDRLCCVYNTGRYQLDKMRAEQAKQYNAERQKIIEESTKRLANLQDQIKNKETERVRRDISIMKLKFDAEEQEKRRREKQSKEQRIQAHLQEMERVKLAKEHAAEVRRFEVAQRFKNQEVNARFAEADRHAQQERAKCVRAQLMAQEMERQRIIRERDENDRACDDKRNQEDDHFFFNYARTLMEDAAKKQRPLYPFQRVIDDYKRANMRDLEVPKVPRHMVTNVHIACRECGESSADDEEYAKARTTIFDPVARRRKPNKEPRKPSPAVEKLKAETLENMVKVKQMLFDDERKRIAASAEVACKPVVDCAPSQSQDRMAAGDTCADGVHSYRIEELKKLNTPAPPVH